MATAMTINVCGKMYDGSVIAKAITPRNPMFAFDDMLDLLQPRVMLGKMRKGMNRGYDDSEIANLFDSPSKVEKMISNFFRKIGVPVAAGLGILTAAGHAFKAHATSLSVMKIGVSGTAVASLAATATKHMGLGERLMPLIHMVQELALPIGIVVASWGMIEMIMGNIDAGKHKLKWAIIGFCGMFLIPEIFFAIRDAFSGLTGGLLGA